MNDAQFISRLFARDRRVVLSFYRQYAPKLRNHIRRKVSSPEDAEEILQDVLCSFLEGLRDFQGKSSIKTYLFSICRYKIVDYYRRKKVKTIMFSQMPHLEKLVSPLITPEEAFDVAVVREKIRTVLSRIAPVYRRVLLLKYWEDASVSDIARELSITFKSAESRLFRARKVFVEAFLSL